MAAAATALALVIARPGPLLGRIAAAGEAWVGAIALQRCLALHAPSAAPTLVPKARPTRCESPIQGLRAPPAGEEGAGGG